MGFNTKVSIPSWYNYKGYKPFTQIIDSKFQFLHGTITRVTNLLHKSSIASFNSFMVQLQGKVFECNNCGNNSFNSFMVQLQVFSLLAIKCFHLGFNSFMVQLQDSQDRKSQVGISRFNSFMVQLQAQATRTRKPSPNKVSIPSWYNYKASHYIAKCGLMLSFNSFMVQLQGADLLQFRG